jgi:DNA ligase-1
MPLPVPVTVADGHLAESMEDLNRLYQHFRAQGYEGVITKDLKGPYRLAARDSSWLKRKPEVTLDLVLLGAVLAVTTKEKAGMFGSYVIGARGEDGSFEEVGDVAGVDLLRDAEIRQLIMTEGLLTGQRIERQSASGTRPGFELAPHIVVTVRFEGIIRDTPTQRMTLRDPKLVVIRPDKGAYEADKTKAIEELYLKQNVG